MWWFFLTCNGSFARNSLADVPAGNTRTRTLIDLSKLFLFKMKRNKSNPKQKTAELFVLPMISPIIDVIVFGGRSLCNNFLTRRFLFQFMLIDDNDILSFLLFIWSSWLLLIEECKSFFPFFCFFFFSFSNHCLRPAAAFWFLGFFFKKAA